MNFLTTTPIFPNRTCLFESREAYARHLDHLETSERAVSRNMALSFRGGCRHTWFIRENELIGKWDFSSTLYEHDLTYKELALEDLDKEWAKIREIEDRHAQRIAKCEVSTDDTDGTFHPRNPYSSVNREFRPDTYWPFRKPSPRLDYDKLQPIPGPTRKGVSLELTGAPSLPGLSLPDLMIGEVELARLTDTTSGRYDVTSVCARMERNTIHYRLLNARTGSDGLPCSPGSSARPLSLGELIELIADSRADENGRPGLYFGRLLDRADSTTRPVSIEALRGAITVDSSFYPLLGRWYDEAFLEWSARELAERDSTLDQAETARNSNVESDDDEDDAIDPAD